jgi:RimJ/RimL family protein N-acetyltransferase
VLLCAYLFEHEDAVRVQATTDVDNAAMRRALEHVGFGFEGVLRGFMPDPTARRRLRDVRPDQGHMERRTRI